MKPHLIVYACALTFASGLAVASVPSLLPDLGSSVEDTLVQSNAANVPPALPEPAMHADARQGSPQRF